MLNLVLLSLITPTQKLKVDSRLGSRPENSKTVAAIKLFQSKVVNMVRPDGKIDPNGRTHSEINVTPILIGIALLVQLRCLSCLI
ncbi:hypothetical protein [Pseudoalteromonas sp. SWXJZ94C]|uniref:hypothetical protein n=1 Tax=Pseudoalteromonas sp. SWXJZ94C TaxID=2792065 RepID=UPI001E2F6D89|nr:hypothetical protein [Pseudoalteromonas sp. SWXJZ94C]